MSWQIHKNALAYERHKAPYIYIGANTERDNTLNPKMRLNGETCDILGIGDPAKIIVAFNNDLPAIGVRAAMDGDDPEAIRTIKRRSERDGGGIVVSLKTFCNRFQILPPEILGTYSLKLDGEAGMWIAVIDKLKTVRYVSSRLNGRKGFWE